ncbi:reverse transcriptase-like protein [Elysia marginata]|uniref:Reverse transcriptase-like protein n=1 Tax=Elysia marginata TaxID=1093978 RepID=A0AAV4GUT6_9GAST|nr:reverse transcriptase-like protein [Elysia marginata]
MEERITPQELRKNIKGLKKKKSPGPDGILIDMIKHLCPHALSTLLDLSNSWRTGCGPEVWKEAHIIPIHKKGKSKTDPLSYRPIGLISCVGKLLEKIINKRLMHHLETNGIISPTQSGFRKNKTTEDQLTYFVQNIENAFQEQKSMLSVFFDLSKAFDTFWKDGLRLKLLQSNIQGTMYKWISNFPHNRTARVKLDGKYYSKQAIMKEGVPQGSAISPTFFLVYINDITPAITSYVKHTLHADDFAIWSTAEYATTAKVRVQATVDKVFKWSQDWGLTINLNKTVTTKFSLKTKQRDVILTMNGQPLPTEDTPTFLGITLDKRLTWKPHIQKINQKAIRRSQIMKKLSDTKSGANSKILRQVYQGYIRPVMEYASPAWSTTATSNLTSLSKTQNQNLRIVLGAIKSTPTKELHKQAEMDTLENRREQRTLTLYEKSKRNPTHPLHNISREKTKNRLKSRKSPNHVMKEKFKENQDLLWQTDRYESLKLAESPWENNIVSISYTIPGIERKNEKDTNNLRVKTLEHIDNTYPHDTWTHIYTDGSSDRQHEGRRRWNPHLAL